MKKRLIASILLCVGLFAGHNASAVDVGAPFVQLGTNELASQDLINANSNFVNAVSAEPAYAPANFLLAVTRVLVLTQSPAGSNFLNGLGIPAAGRDYYDWTAQPATNSAGKPEFPKGYNSGTAIAFYTNTLMPVISASLTNLSNITDTNFQLVLPGAVTGGGAYAFQDVTVDYGDVQVLRAMLSAAQFFGYSLSANNANADMSWIETNIQAKTISIQSLLNQFPSLAAKQNTAALAPSEQAAINAIQEYFGAATFILDDRTDTNALFNLSTNDIPKEIEFQTVLTNILAALTTPTQLSPSNVDSTLYLAPYFAGNVSLRSLFPKFNGDAYVPDSVPDYTFGGILPDLPPYQTESALLKKFPNYAGIYTGDYGLTDSSGMDAAGNFAVYVSTNGQLTIVGFNSGDQGTYITNSISFSTDGSGFGVLVQATMGNGGNWQVSNGSYSANGYIDNAGDFFGTIYYNSNGVFGGPLTVYLNGYLASPTGPYQNSAGYYTGSYSGSQSGSLYSIVAADGEIYFTTGKTDPGGNSGGSSYLYNSDNDFGTVEPDATEVVGILNSGSVSVEGYNIFFNPITGNTNFYSSDSVSPGYIVGIYTNILSHYKGTFSLSRSSDVTPQVPPVITTNLPPGLAVLPGSTTTFQFGVSGTPPLGYQWYINGSPISGVTASTLVMSNGNAGTSYEISATVNNALGGATSEVCAVTVQTSIPPIASYEGIYIGTNSGAVSDSLRYLNGAFAAYVSTNGQLAVVGQDAGDGTGANGNDFGFAFQTTLFSGGYFQYTTSYLSVSGNIDSLGDFNATLYYPQASGGQGETVYLTGNLESPYGPFETTDGLYTGTYSGAQSGNLDVIFDANSNLFLVPLDPTPNGPYGNAGDGVFGQFFNSTHFSIPSISGTLVSGTLNPGTFTINGTYTNSNDSTTHPDHGTFIVTRSGPVPILYPPTITTDLPANVTAPLGNTVKFSIAASGSAPLSYQWYLATPVSDFNPIAGANANTLVVSNNLLTTTGNYAVYATVANGAGSTNSQACTVTVTSETNVPTLAITSPTPGQLFSNSTFIVSGTASDKLAVTDVVVVVNGHVYGGLPTNGLNFNNWFVPVLLSPGSNTISAYAINEGPIDSKTATVLMNYVVTSPLTVITNGEGTVNPVFTAPVRISQPLTLTAAGINGFQFASWYAGTNEPLTYYTNKPAMSLSMSNGLIVEANFVDGNKPYLKITNATTGMIWSNTTFTVMGVATDDEEVATVTYTLNGATTTLPPIDRPIAAWQAPLSLTAGTNLFSAYATATNGNISATQTVAIVYLATNQLIVQTSGKGTISPNYSNSWLYVGRNYSMTASAASGFKFINWTAETNSGLLAPGFSLFSTNATAIFTMQTGLVMQANFKDLNPPYLRITNMLTQLITSNATFTPMGVATDDEQMASVMFSFNGSPTNPVNSANGWTNWNEPLALGGGTNVFSAYATATNGNMATDTVKIVSISANPLTLQISGKGTISPNYSNALLDAGINYNMTASAAIGFKFINWTGTTNGTFVLYGTNPAVTFMMQTSLVMQANFKDLNPPYLRITNLPALSFTSNTTFEPFGVATDDEQMSFVTYSLNGSATNPVFTPNGWTNWSASFIAPLPLRAGTNVFSAYATATNGNMATNTVTVVRISTNVLTLQISGGKGTISPNYSNAWLNAGINYNMSVSPASGFKFVNWTGTTNGNYVVYGTNPAVTFMMQTGLVMQANLIDTLKPYLKITNPISALLATNASSYTVMGVATDDEEVATVNYTFNGTPSSLAVSNNIYAWQTPSLTLSEGTNTFSAWAVATNGNLSATNTIAIIRWPTITVFPIATNNVAYPAGQGAFDGSNYLAVFRTGPARTPSATGQFVSTNGTLEGGPLLLDTNGVTGSPYIDFDGTNYLVAWADFSTLEGAAPIRGVFVSPVTQQPVGSIHTLSQSTTVADSGNIAFGGGLYFLMWQDGRTTPSSMYGAMIDTSGTNVSGDFLLGTNGAEGEFAGPQAAYDGTNFLAVWSSATGKMTISGELINASGPLGSPFVIYTNSGPTGYTAPSVVFNGTNYLVLFNIGITSSTASASGFHILGRLVTTGGTVLTNQITVTTDAGPQIIPGADFDGANFLASWNQGLNPYSVSTSGSIYGRFFNANGSATTAEFPIFTANSGLKSFASGLSLPIINLGSGYTATWAPVFFDGSKFVLIGGLGKLTSTGFTNGVIYGAFVSP